MYCWISNSLLQVGPHVVYADAIHHCCAIATIAGLYPPALNGAKHALLQWRLECVVLKCKCHVIDLLQQ